MKWVVMVLLGLVPGTALGSGRGSYGPHSRYDASLDFSKQFDEEVKWQREHARAEADDDAPPRDDDAPRVKHRRRHSHRAR